MEFLLIDTVIADSAGGAYSRGRCGHSALSRSFLYRVSLRNGSTGKCGMTSPPASPPSYRHVRHGDARGGATPRGAAGGGADGSGAVGVARGAARARPYCRFVRPRIHFIPDSRTHSVVPFLKRQCDRYLGAAQELDGRLPLGRGPPPGARQPAGGGGPDAAGRGSWGLPGRGLLIARRLSRQLDRLV